MIDSLIELRAEVAERAEDLRIASKHRAEAGARPHTPANVRAYEGALLWERLCAEREQEARGRLISRNLASVG